MLNSSNKENTKTIFTHNQIPAFDYLRTRDPWNFATLCAYSNHNQDECDSAIWGVREVNRAQQFYFLFRPISTHFALAKSYHRLTQIGGGIGGEIICHHISRNMCHSTSRKMYLWIFFTFPYMESCQLHPIHSHPVHLGMRPEWEMCHSWVIRQEQVKAGGVSIPVIPASFHSFKSHSDWEWPSNDKKSHSRVKAVA